MFWVGQGNDEGKENDNSYKNKETKCRDKKNCGTIPFVCKINHKQMLRHCWTTS